MSHTVRLSRRQHVSLTLLGFILAASGALGDERFDTTVITEELRSYYDDLSDTEFVSLKPGPVLFPLVHKAWARGPLSANAVMGFETPTYVTDAAVEFQRPLLVPGSDPSIRARTLQELSESHSPLAIAMLVDQLQVETDPKLIADILRVMANQGVDVLGNKVLAFMNSAEPMVRFQAYRLYARQQEIDLPQVLGQLAEEDKELQVFGLGLLADHAAGSRLEPWLPFWESNDDEVRRAALSGMLRVTDVHQFRGEILTLCREGSVPMKRTIAMNLHAKLDPGFCGELLGMLAAEELSALRTAAAQACSRLSLPSLEPTLVRLATDPAFEVRLAAAKGLSTYPTRNGFEALVKLSGDLDSLPIRVAARGSMLAMANDFPVATELAGPLQAESAYIRNNAYQVSWRLSSPLHMGVIARQLTTETRADNVRNAIRALTYGRHRAAATQIMAFADHESASVRAAVAEAIGILEIRQAAKRLGPYALDEADQSIKSAALIAMGQLAEDTFSEPLLAVLNRTNLAAAVASSETDRAIAAWAVSRLQNPSPTVLQRLQSIITKPVVKTEMGPQYDGDLVRVAACWALVDLADRDRDPDLVARAQEMIKVLQMEDPDFSQGGGGSMMPIPTSDMLRAYGQEAAQFLAGQPITRSPVPLGTYRFSFIAYEK